MTTKIKKSKKKAIKPVVGKIAAGVELVSVFLVETEAKSLIWDIPKGDNGIFIDVNYQTNAKKIKDGFETTVDLNLNGGIKENKEILIVKAEFRLVYNHKNVESFSIKDLREFAAVNSVYNVWPYWREYVQNMVVRMNLPPLTVPVLRVPESFL